MKFEISREALIKPLQLVTGVVERRQTLPVLSNVQLVLEKGVLSLTGTDLEVELIGRVPVTSGDEGEITVPARKFADICKNLPENASIVCELADSKLIIKSGRSRFTLSTLPASEFPAIEDSPGEMSFSVSQQALKAMLDSTSFAMAQQDVRYYLNGMLFEVTPTYLRVVATDGHRLSMNTHTTPVDGVDARQQVIVPRKGILELTRLLAEGDENVSLSLGSSHIRASTENFTFTSKLVDGKFPDYDRVLPKGGDKVIEADRQALRQSLNRTAILSNEKFRGIRLMLSKNEIKIVANNPEQEEAEETIAIEYSGSPLEIGFNVSYLIDVLGVLSSDTVQIIVSDPNSSALIQSSEDSDALYVVMPMRL